MVMFRDLIYSQETIKGVAATKAPTHLPKIKAPDEVKADQPFEVEVSVGPHPSTSEHYISKVEIYLSEEGRDFNPVHLASINIAPSYVEPTIKLTLKLKKNSTIHALAYCTLHGIWESRKEIKVK